MLGPPSPVCAHESKKPGAGEKRNIQIIESLGWTEGSGGESGWKKSGGHQHHHWIDGAGSFVLTGGQEVTRWNFQ